MKLYSIMIKYKAHKISPHRSTVKSKDNIYTSVKLLLRVSQVLGLAPVAWPHLKSSLWGTVYTLLLFIAIAAWFIYTTILNFINDYPGQTATFIIPSLFNSSAIYLTSLSALGFSIIAIRKKLNTIMQLVSQADKIILVESPSCIHKRFRWMTIIQTAILFLTLTTLGIFDNWIWTGRFWNYHDYTGRYIAQLINAVLALQYSSFALLLKHRFHKLNNLLQTSEFGIRFIEDNRRVFNIKTSEFLVNDMMFKRSLTSVDILFGPQLERPTQQPGSNVSLLAVHPMKPSECDENLFELRRAHAMLCEVASMINGMYGFQMLMAMTSEFIGIVWLLYCILVAIMDPKTSQFQIDNIALCLAWLTYRCLKTVYVVSSCHMAQAEAHHTGIVVQESLLLEEVQQKQTNTVKILQLQRFSQQLVHFRYQVNFTACGFFPFNMTLLNSIVGAVTTYIIILIQFHNK